MQWGLFLSFSSKFSGKTLLFVSENHDLHRIAAVINQPRSQLPTLRIIKQYVKGYRKI